MACALVSLALVQNRHTDAILAPALYTKYQLEWRAMRVCFWVFACVCLCRESRVHILNLSGASEIGALCHIESYISLYGARGCEPTNFGPRGTLLSRVSNAFSLLRLCTRPFLLAPCFCVRLLIGRELLLLGLLAVLLVLRRILAGRGLHLVSGHAVLACSHDGPHLLLGAA